MAALSPLLAPFHVDVIPFQLPLQQLPDPVQAQQAAHHPGHSQCRLVSDLDLLGNRGHWPPLVQFPHQVDPAREVDFAVLQLRTGQVVEPSPTVPAAVTAQITPVRRLWHSTLVEPQYIHHTPFGHCWARHVSAQSTSLGKKEALVKASVHLLSLHDLTLPIIPDRCFSVQAPTHERQSYQ
jgi:hypothetical protein